MTESETRTRRDTKHPTPSFSPSEALGVGNADLLLLSLES